MRGGAARDERRMESSHRHCHPISAAGGQRVPRHLPGAVHRAASRRRTCHWIADRAGGCDPGADMSISIVIATYNRAALLCECLRHLSDQRFEAEDEVVVVDNGSEDDTPRIIEVSRQRFPVRLRHLTELRPGKSHAVTAAITAAKGDVLA